VPEIGITSLISSALVICIALNSKNRIQSPSGDQLSEVGGGKTNPPDLYLLFSEFEISSEQLTTKRLNNNIMQTKRMINSFPSKINYELRLFDIECGSQSISAFVKREE
jgi:hypothetical protein